MSFDTPGPKMGPRKQSGGSEFKEMSVFQKSRLKFAKCMKTPIFLKTSTDGVRLHDKLFEFRKKR